MSLKVYDVLGREVVSLVEERLDAGNYTAEFNAENLSSGVYISELKSETFHQIRKMVLMK